MLTLSEYSKTNEILLQQRYQSIIRAFWKGKKSLGDFLELKACWPVLGCGRHTPRHSLWRLPMPWAQVHRPAGWLPRWWPTGFDLWAVPHIPSFPWGGLPLRSYYWSYRSHGGHLATRCLRQCTQLPSGSTRGLFHILDQKHTCMQCFLFQN